MPVKAEVIDLADEDEFYESIEVPDDIEATEAMPLAGPSRQRNTSSQSLRVGSNGSVKSSADAFDARQEFKMQLAKLDVELKSVRDEISSLRKVQSELEAKRSSLIARTPSILDKGDSRNPSTTGSQLTASKSSKNTINYQTSNFDWSGSILAKMKQVFGLDQFRLCQEGVINAALDQRDIVCVMPTGGGKSLTYQLPAVMGSKGLTVVISPLLALIWDQVRALKALGVECVMLTGSTSTEEQNAAYRRMEEGSRNGGKEIRLCYVTPEKIAKSKRFMSILEKVHTQGRLTRFVIDEAHCCSQLGHDFRPDYKKLGTLKALFPKVPIQAVTATLSTRTLPDLLKILKMPPICDGSAANNNGTVFFTAPLFRPNLHYSVQSKPTSLKACVEKMGLWIKDNHRDESGIIYCLSKKDAETVADELLQWSGGIIKTGVYHAGVTDFEKERIHIQWREGEVNCICATIAFGLGIDKGDVRYVIHHSMSKSLDGYYQETGRAGRDGKKSDCILFYRGQDSSRLSSLIYGDTDGTSKLYEMLKFAEDKRTCRKIAFARYFSTSAQLPTGAWDHGDTLIESAGSGAVASCGSCDNCLRDPDSIVTKDVTLDTWKILKVVEEVDRSGGRGTLANVADLVRGLGGGNYTVMSSGSSKKRKPDPEKATLDIGKVAGSKVELSKDDTESLLIHLTILDYLRDSYSATAYSVNVYVGLGAKASRLKRLSRDEVERGVFADPIECTFPAPKARKSTKKKTSSVDQDASGSEGEEDKPKGKGKKGKAKPKKKVKKPIDEEKDLASASDDEFDGDDDDEEIMGHTRYGILSSSDAEEASWDISQPTKAARGTARARGGSGRKSTA